MYLEMAKKHNALLTNISRLFIKKKTTEHKCQSIYYTCFKVFILQYQLILNRPNLSSFVDISPNRGLIKFRNT